MSASGKFSARFALALAGLAPLAGGAAWAQVPDAPGVVSPLRVETDHNGVNLVTGLMTMDIPVLSVPGAPNLRFDRVQNAAPYVSGEINGEAGEIPQGSYSVHTGGAASEAFRCPDNDCESVTGTGSTFQPSASGRGPATYRQAGTGVRYAFNVLHVSQFGAPSKMVYYASSALWPNGESISYFYQTGYLAGDPFNRPFRRPITLTSNLGYRIDIAYHPGQVGTIEWNSPATATLIHTGSGAVLGRLTYSADGTTITQYGEGLQNPRTYSCAGCANSLGASTEVSDGSLTLPGEATPSIQVTRLSPPPGLPGARLVGSVARDGVTWNYAYTNVGLVGGNLTYDRLTVTGPNGFNQVYNFHVSDQRNVLTSMTDSIGRTTGFTFDIAYRPTRIVAPELNEAGAQYDPQGNIVSRTATAKPGSGLAPITQSAQYPEPPGGIPNMCTVECWRPTSSRDGMGRQTDYQYDANGQLTQQLDPADAAGVRRSTTIVYAGGRREEVTVCGTGAPCGTDPIRTEYDYWESTFLPSAERRIDGAAVLTTTYAYNAAGRLLVTDGPLAGTDDATYNRYDAYGRRTWEIGARAPNGLRIALRHTYRNSDDKVTRTEEGTIPAHDSTALTIFRRTDFAYDSRRNPARETVSTGAGAAQTLVQRTFDQSNRLECEARRMNPAAFGSPPASACALGPEGTGTNAFGPDRITRNSYDNAGQLLTEERGVGTPLRQDYARYTYTPNGKRASVTDANGNRADLRYDGHDRQSRWVFPSRTVDGVVNEADYEAYTYDANGNRLTLRKRDGSTLSFQYDNLNRVTRKTVPERAGLAATHTRDVFYGYDVRNLQLHARFDSASGQGVTNTFDGFGRLLSSATNLDGVARTLQYQYDSAGNRTRITHADGQYFAQSYDALGRPSLLSYQGSGSLLQLGYWAHGLPSIATRGNGTSTTLAYDGVLRLNGLTLNLADTSHDAAWTYAHNPASQIVTRSRNNDIYASNTAYDVTRAYSVNGLNQYTSAGPANFTYDANGNLTSDGSDTWLHDVENRLVQASGSHSATLRYDPLGRLYEIVGGGTTTRFLWDGDALVAEYNSAGTMLRRHVHSVGADVPIVSYEGSAFAQWRYLFGDHQGSIVALSGPSATQLNAYDEWGIPNATNTGRFQYTGQIWLSELGLYYYKARIYSPTLGRFLQTDPVGYQDQMNLYAYVGNDPVNGADPSGLCSTGSRAAEAIGADAVGCNVMEGFQETNTSASGVQNAPQPGRGVRNAPLPSRDVRRETARRIPRPTRGNETGGQALQERRTGEITYRTGHRAGVGTPDSFSHNPAPEGSNTILRSHAHLRRAPDPRSSSYSSGRYGNNAPGPDDLDVMRNSGIAVQTIGPDVTTTAFRRDWQDFLIICSGDRSRLPNIPGVTVIEEEPE